MHTFLGSREPAFKTFRGTSSFIKGEHGIKPKKFKGSKIFRAVDDQLLVRLTFISLHGLREKLFDHDYSTGLCHSKTLPAMKR